MEKSCFNLLMALFVLISASVFPGCTTTTTSSFDHSLQGIVGQCQDQVKPQLSEGKKFRVVIGNFIRNAQKETTPLSGSRSSFGRYIAKQISAKISNSVFEEYSRDRLNEIFLERKISYSDLANPEKRQDAELLKKLQNIPDVQGIFVGNYWRSKDAIALQVELLDIQSCRVLASHSADISLDQIPQGILSESALALETKKRLPSVKEPKFGLQVWVDKKDDGATYKMGELLKVHVKSAQDCFIQISQISADGKSVVIFPNLYATDAKIKAGEVHTFPPQDEARYRFRLDGPCFGKEVIKVVATATNPIPDSVGGKSVYVEPVEPVAEGECDYTLLPDE
jgi:hypothetical protein